MKKYFSILTLMLVMASFNVNAQQREEFWLEYDNGVFMTDIGLLSGVPIYWGNMFTPSQLADYDGYQLTKIKIWDHTPYNGYLIIYQDNSTTGPLDVVYTQQYTVEGTNDWTEIDLETPVALDVTKNLWITFNNTDGEFTIPAADDCGDANSRWISEDGREWSDASTVGMPPFTWMIRSLISNDGVSVVELGAENAQIHPNPATSVLNISANNMLNVSIFDLTGREIGHHEAMSNELAIDIAGYQSGLYLVRIETKSGIIVKKVTIQ